MTTSSLRDILYVHALNAASEGQWKPIVAFSLQHPRPTVKEMCSLAEKTAEKDHVKMVESLVETATAGHSDIIEAAVVSAAIHGARKTLLHFLPQASPGVQAFSLKKLSNAEHAMQVF